MSKKKIIAGICVGVLVIGAVWYVGWGRRLMQQTVDTSVKIEKSAGQTVVYAQIKEINGNEITYALAEEITDVTTTQKETQGSDRGQRGQGNQGGGNMPSFDAGSMPSFDAGSMPSFDASSMPDMSQMQGGGRGPNSQGGRGSQWGGNAYASADTGRITYDGVTYRISNETVTTYIPVGTTVTTKLGTKTTFSRLGAEDYVALVLEKDGGEEVIMAVYIIG